MNVRRGKRTMFQVPLECCGIGSLGRRTQHFELAVKGLLLFVKVSARNVLQRQEAGSRGALRSHSHSFFRGPKTTLRSQDSNIFCRQRQGYMLLLTPCGMPRSSLALSQRVESVARQPRFLDTKIGTASKRDFCTSARTFVRSRSREFDTRIRPTWRFALVRAISRFPF